MPICDKPAQLTTGNKSATEVDNHASEAAKVKRNREHAYFNSYNFDAIEVLPYDEEGEEDEKKHQTINKTNKLTKSSSLSSKSNSSEPISVYGSSSSRSSDSRCMRSKEVQYTYLQRFNTLFKNNSITAEKVNFVTSSEILSQVKTLRNETPTQIIQSVDKPAALRIIEDDSLEADDFALPRPILKYQNVDFVNSMPLAVISGEHAASSKYSQNSYSDHNGNSRSNHSNIISNNNSNIKGAALVMSTNSSQIHYPNSSGNTRQNQSDRTGFLLNADEISTKATKALQPLKKTSRSSSTSSVATTSATASVLSVEQNSDNKSKNIRKNLVDTKNKSKTKILEGPQRGRANSHQSHYSTDKSGSSGYYSSNVCSTYSIEDHIYCEPVIDILELSSSNKIKEAVVSLKPPQQLLATTTFVSKAGNVVSRETRSNSRSREMNGAGKRIGVSAKEADDDEEEADESDGKSVALRRKKSEPSTFHFNENLRILETSIANLDRHLKSFPRLSSQEQHVASYVQTHHSNTFTSQADFVEKLRTCNHLPTIMEGYDPNHKPSRTWQEDIVDDSLLDIDLDSFLLVNERQSSKRSKSTVSTLEGGIDNPNFLTDELEENNYKCAKYINSCPEDAYRVESDIITSSASLKSNTVEHFLKRYEDQLHFQNTRELLEDVRDKIRLLSQTKNEIRSLENVTDDNKLPKELEDMIKTLKYELEIYLTQMNQHSELEIRQLCSGIVKNENIVKMQKAFERRHSTASQCNFVNDFGHIEVTTECNLVPVKPEATSIRCASDPNFKMKRKSLVEVFPLPDCYIQTIVENQPHDANFMPKKSQLQRNLSFQNPTLNQINTRGASAGDMKGEKSEKSAGREDKDSMLEWHRKKPSIWEMYYGTNRINQSLLGKRNGTTVHNNQPTMSYPSSRPESDFTLDLPRAEQLRIKMEKEKKFRRRCRYITSFLSLVFFLLTVMVVSLVLTRGKRMFGSMI